MKIGAHEVHGSAFALTSPAVRTSCPQPIQAYKDWISHLEERARLIDKSRSPNSITTQDEARDLQPKRRLRSSERIVAISATRLDPYSPWSDQPTSASDNRLVV